MENGDVKRPLWLPDNQTFLVVSIVTILAAVLMILLLKDFGNVNDKVFGAMLTALGVVCACFKDVFGFFFGSSKSSANKDDVINKIAMEPAPVPPAPVAPAPVVTVGPVDTANVTTEQAKP